MELMAPGRRARSRYFRLEDAMRGMGALIIEPHDFPRAERQRLVVEINAAYLAGVLEGEMLETARRIANALRSPDSMLEGLRVHLQADGRELVGKVRSAATTVPALGVLADWIM